jgi:hypothetical protein
MPGRNDLCPCGSGKKYKRCCANQSVAGDFGSSPDPNQLLYRATHEAGHAVIAVVLGLELESVDIRERTLPDGTISTGYTKSPVPVASITGEEAAFPFMVQTFAGPLAEAKVNPFALDFGSHLDDLRGAHKIAVVALCQSVEIENHQRKIEPAEVAKKQPQITALMAKASDEAGRLVELHMPAITETASALQQRKFLRGDKVAAIVSSNPPERKRTM